MRKATYDILKDIQIAAEFDRIQKEGLKLPMTPERYKSFKNFMDNPPAFMSKFPDLIPKEKPDMSYDSEKEELTIRINK